MSSKDTQIEIDALSLQKDRDVWRQEYQEADRGRKFWRDKYAEKLLKSKDLYISLYKMEIDLGKVRNAIGEIAYNKIVDGNNDGKL